MNLQKIIKYYEKNELWEPIRNVSFFIWGGGWNNKKYYKSYKNRDNSGCFILAKKNKNLGLFLAFNKLNNLSIEVLEKYIKNQRSIKYKKNEYRKIQKEINLLDLGAQLAKGQNTPLAKAV